MFSNNSTNIPVAHPVDNPVKRVQVPPNLRPGDVFVVTEFGTPFNVVVPEGATPGCFLEVILPNEAKVISTPSSSVGSAGIGSEGDGIKIDKSTAGAAVVGGVVGVLLFGTVGGIVLAGGAVYAASQSNTDIGKGVRKVGKEAFKNMEKAKNWVEKKVKCVDR